MSAALRRLLSRVLCYEYDVCTHRNTRSSIYAGLDPFECFKADKPFMLGLLRRNTPFFMLNVPRIQKLGQNIGHGLQVNFALANFPGEGWLRFQKALHFALSSKST